MKGKDLFSHAYAHWGVMSINGSVNEYQYNKLSQKAQVRFNKLTGYEPAGSK